MQEINLMTTSKPTAHINAHPLPACGGKSKDDEGRVDLYLYTVKSSCQLKETHRSTLDPS